MLARSHDDLKDEFWKWEVGMKIHKSLCPVKKKKDGSNWEILDTDWVLDGFEELFLYVSFICYNSIVVFAFRKIFIY